MSTAPMETDGPLGKHVGSDARLRAIAVNGSPGTNRWPAPAGRVDLCAVDPDLAPPGRQGSLPVAVFRLGAGPLPPPPSTSAGEAHFGFLILKGVALRDVSVCGRSTAELFGPGDLIQPTGDTSESTLTTAVGWTVLSQLLLAELSGPVARGLAGEPSTVAAIVERAVARAREGALERSIASHFRVDMRVLGYLWHLADRFGKVTSTGVRVELPLTHATLARLVGARRPTVTTALQRLIALGYLRREGRAFLLTGAASDLEALDAQSPAQLAALGPALAGAG